MALRKIIFASIFASTPLSAIGQNLDASDLLNLGNQILKGIQQPQATTPQQAPVTPEIRTETRTVPAYSRSEVSETQALLVQLGYDPGVVDGVMGNRTSNAIRQFQAAQGLPQTGQPSPGLLVRLRSFAGTSGAANTGIVESVSGSQAITPSFDCGRATTAVELAICSSAELAALDKRLDAIYRNALQTSQGRNGLVADQRAWLDIRNRCNANAVCIRSALVHRIDDLGKLAASDGRTVASPSPVIPALELETPRTDGSATAVALVAPANIAERASGAVPVCLEPSVAESVRPLAEAAVGKSLTIANMNARVGDATQLLVVYDDMYLLVGGDCIEQMRYAIERDYSGAYDGVSFTQLVAAQAESTTLPTTAAAPAADLNISTERLPLTRLYLSQYLNEVPREMRIEKFKKYIGDLAAHPTETPVLSRDEVNGRNPEFVANSAIGRWDDALQSLSLAPPVSVVASVDLSRGNYDFARGVMTFPNAPATEVDGKRYLSDGSGLFAPLPDSQKQQVTRTEDLLLWFLQDQITPDFMKITLDRMVPMPEIAMTAERAEQFILSEMRTIAELHYSIDEISPLTESRVLGFDGTLIGARVFTDTGDDLIAWTPDQLPLVAVAMPAPEPEAPVAGSRLARPRDIIAAVAQSTGRDRAELIGSLYPPTSQDSFARRDEIEMLASTAEPVELGGFWMTGNGRYSEYDFATQTFGFDYLNLGYSNNLSRNEGGIKRDKLFRLTNVDDYGIRFPMTEDEAQRLQQAAGGSDAIYRALIVADPPERADGELGLPMEARVAEIVVLRPGSDPQMEFKSDILARIAFASGSEAVIPEVAIASEAVPAGAYDILDVRIRQALDTVLPAIEASFLPETVIYGRREVWVDQQNLRRPITLTTPLSEATILVRDGGGDSLTIFHEPLLPDNPVTGIARTISFAEGARPAPDAVMAVLVDKYGDMATQQKYAFDWFRATPLPQEAQSGEMSTHEVIQQETAAQMATAKAFRCKQLLSGITGKLDYDAQSLLRTGNSDFNFSPYPVVDDGNATISLLATDPLWSINRVDVSRPECDEDIVLAAIEPDSNGLVSVLRVLVTNRGYLAEIEAQAKQALINMNTSETGVKPEIKL